MRLQLTNMERVAAGLLGLLAIAVIVSLLGVVNTLAMSVRPAK